MAGHGSQHVVLQIFSQRHAEEVGLQPCNTAKSIMLSPHIHPDYSPSRSEFVEKLIDTPGGFWFHEGQRLSNLHRTVFRKGAGHSSAGTGIMRGVVQQPDEADRVDGLTGIRKVCSHTIPGCRGQGELRQTCARPIISL